MSKKETANGTAIPKSGKRDFNKEIITKEVVTCKTR